MSSEGVREVEPQLHTAFVGRAPMVLAVSGGLDSMVLMDAAVRIARGQIAVVATFDHGSGPHAARAAAFVCAQAAARGLSAVVGHAAHGLSSEAMWREARWRFLRAVAARFGGVVVTAHTEDDQVETVLMRAMRGAGARGLAALYALRPDVVRPFVGLTRSTLERYAATRGVAWVDDPTNSSLRHFRNRVRRELLPALLDVRPQLRAELLAVARRAADWRSEIDDLARRLAAPEPDAPAASLSVALADVAGYDAESLAVLWPALAARVGLAVDRRGTRRIAQFTTTRGRAGAAIQLSGGWEVVRERDRLTLRRARGKAPGPATLPSAGGLRWGRWSFAQAMGEDAGDAWFATLPEGQQLVVRAWQPGDRMAGVSGKPRRVKRFFGDAGVLGPDRAGWPVVLAGEEIVWIPGVGRGAAAAGASRTSGLFYSCELNDR